MKLQVGERLEGGGPGHQPGGYVVTSVVRETPWHGLYTGKKIFYNFDFTAKRVRETDEVEWLDVFLRTNRYPILDDPSYVQQRRALARAELRAVLGNRHSNLWPEPLDLLEIDNTRDAFAFTDERATAAEPVLVYTRPHGRFTAEWQEQVLPVSSILSVLAEILEFIRQAHDENLLLLGLGPASLLIDGSDRVHYVGTEMVLSQQNPLLRDASATAQWQRLFPADRFVRGYSAPECFDPNRRPDARADLYAWGSLAFSLLTGSDLGKIAREQGKPWTAFQEVHWRQLEEALATYPQHSLTVWAEQIGLPAERLLANWPRNVITAFRMLLSADPERRPGSAAELLGWLADPPPPPVAELIALHTDVDAGKLLLDCTGLEPGAEMLIQCALGGPPRRLGDGTLITEGPVRPVIGLRHLPLTEQPIFYTVFTRRGNGDRVVYSPGVAAELWKPTEKNLREWVEAHAAGAFDAHQIPTRVGMVLGALDLHAVTDSLLGSQVQRVRAWGLRRVEQTVRAQGRVDAAEPILWRYLGERSAELRMSAATTLWTFHANKTDTLLLRIIEALEASPVDAPIPLMEFLRQLQLPDSRIRTVLEQLETKRPTECPLCQKPLTLGERAGHLQAEHGYLVYQGDVLPADAVFARLWERTLQQQDRNAHEELTSMYLGLPDVKRSPDAAAQHYVAGLQRFLLGEGQGSNGIPVALPYDCVMAYQTNLRGSSSFLPIARRLLDSPHRRLRDLGGQAALPYIQEQLRGKASVPELRRALNTLCSDLEHTDLQIDLCGQLAQLGTDQALVQDCIAQLQEDRLVTCTECQANVRSRDLELHLRRAHQVFQFRGTRKTYVATRETILKAVCAQPADLGAWKSLQSLVGDRHPQETERYLVGWLYQHVKEVDGDERSTTIPALAETMVAAQAADKLLPLFTAPSKNAKWDLIGQRLALEVCSRLSAPLPPRVVPMVVPFLDSKDLPRKARENAVLALMRALGKDGPRADELLRAYVGQSSKKRGIEKLEHLEQRLGHSLALDVVVRELEDEVRMSCPRCPTELRKKDMVGHLWDKHHLVLDGQRVREPWRVIEDWVVDYALEKDPQVLQRCRELAAQDDPQTGLARLQRLLYRRGVRDRELLNEMKALVKSRKATLCPHCCTSIAVEAPPVVEPLTLTDTALQGFGYQLEVSERGLFPSLVIETPDAIIFRDREPGRFMTRLGGIVFLIFPMMLIAWLILFRLIDHEQRLPLSILLAAGAGLLAAGLLFLIWPAPRPVRDRVVKAAWKLLVPEMLQDDLDRRGWSFLDGLAKTSEEVESFQPSQDLLLECCEDASEAGRADAVAVGCLATLSRRCIADMKVADEDPFDFVLTLASECFKGKLPISFLSDLLENFHGKKRSGWNKDDLNRLPILIAQRAFTADVDLDDWFSLGRAFPVLSTVLNLESRWHWLQFHALWAQYNRRPWENVGPAVGMLDLAKTAGEFKDLLGYYPDVLLYVAKANLVIGTKGVWIEGVCITSYQAGTEITMRRPAGEFEIVIGEQRIRCAENPQAYLSDIQRWLNWYFFQFVRSVPATPRAISESKHRMWQLGKMACTECGRPLFPCPADLGVALR